METSKFHFDSVEHIYTIGGAFVPSVTGLISEFGVSDPTWYGLQAKIRGTHVHTATLYYDEGDLDFDSLDPIIQPYVKAYISFRLEIKGLVYTHMETSLFDEANQLAGTFDRYGTLNGKPVLIDIKSGTFPKWVAIQLAGYRHLIIQNNMPTPTEYYALILKGDGNYKFEKIENIDILKGKQVFDSFLKVKEAQRIFK